MWSDSKLCMISTLLKFVKMCIITQNMVCSSECPRDLEKNVHLLLLDKVFYKYQFDPIDWRYPSVQPHLSWFPASWICQLLREGLTTRRQQEEMSTSNCLSSIFLNIHIFFSFDLFVNNFRQFSSLLLYLYFIPTFYVLLWLLFDILLFIILCQYLPLLVQIIFCGYWFLNHWTKFV